MACFGPIRMFRSRHQTIKLDRFGEPQRDKHGDLVITSRMVTDKRLAIDDQAQYVPCGRCIGCQQKRAAHWAVRCLHESKMHYRNSFITLTYNDKHCPSSGSLSKYQWKLFEERLRYARRFTKGVRYFMCGEYGDQNRRPHYHAILFGVDFPDKRPHGRNDQNDQTYTSKELQSLWTLGFSLIGTVTPRSAHYVAKYMVKGESSDVPPGVEPPFQLMSRRPGIGRTFYDRFKAEITRDDFTLMDGRETSVPRYYDELLRSEMDSTDYERNKQLRKERSLANPEEHTLLRSRAREEAAIGARKVRKL